MRMLSVCLRDVCESCFRMLSGFTQALRNKAPMESDHIHPNQIKQWVVGRIQRPLGT